MKSQGVDVGNVISTKRTRVFVSADGANVATIDLEDQTRDDAAQAIEALVKLDWSVSMLSGDLQAVAQRVGESVGIEPSRIHGQTMPEEKLRWIRDEQTRGRAVVMIGDGVNDAASLAAADVGIGVRGGAEASLAAADVYIATPGVMNVVELVRTARKTMKIVKRNFAITLFYNLVAGTLAICGLMNPLLAAIIMPLSSLTTIGFATASARRKAGA